MGILARSKQHVVDRTGEQILAQILVDLLLGGRDVLQDLLQQCVVVVRQYFDQCGPGGLLGLAHLGRQLDLFRCLAAAISIRALGNQIDITGDPLGIVDRHLPQHQGRSRMGLQGVQRVPDLHVRGVDLVDEHHERNAQILQQPEDRCGGGRARRAWFANQHRQIGHRECRGRVVQKLDRARTIHDRPGIAQIAAMAQMQFGIHPAAHIAGSAQGCSGRRHQRVEEGRFPAAIWADQGHRAGFSIGRYFRHRTSPFERVLAGNRRRSETFCAAWGVGSRSGRSFPASA